ncbi:NADPH-dependent F420 reductase [Streptomyces fungicidicus]|uniref:NADPH-dependent F420 reductase n=1 Tax=Streptomyces fungicidicus TaxID=68203 RepID=UPI001E57AE20|nr:NADP oxidoreductase [Streptomyces fungicidicus]
MTTTARTSEPWTAIGCAGACGHPITGSGGRASDSAPAAAWAGALAGKVVVDISNPVDFSTFDSLVVEPGTSAAEQIAAAAPGARVVKAFKTTFAGPLVAGEVAGRPLDVFVAGDDDDAKRSVSELVSSAGLRPLDVGPLRRARELEGFQFLHMASQERLGLNWSSALAILP